MKTLAVIPARGGSKGVVGKNIRTVAGKPLLHWTAECAQATPAIDQLVCSTDDPDIANIAEAANVETLMRPAELATDTASAVDAALHALDALNMHDGWLIWLQPTSPLRLPIDIEQTLALCLENGATSAATVCEAEHSPYWMMALNEGNAIAPLFPESFSATARQSLRPAYRPNGAVYVVDVPWLRTHKRFWCAETGMETRAHIMPPERSVDIDSELDVQLAELLLKKQPS